MLHAFFITFVPLFPYIQNVDDNSLDFIEFSEDRNSTWHMVTFNLC